ncbi:MAG: chemotaxis protein CheW [Spirochaetales bacterium]|nr:chemotaxis protein CheW [Spirochaetales bacterium]
MSTIDRLIASASEDQSQRQIVDYKMVTFTLGGKDYGIDILNVKEIHKTDFLTPVPNTAPFVKGVSNLRGEIISIIDLRTMFSLSTHEAAGDEAEDIIFLKVEDHLVGVVVDSINDVVGIDSSTIQPPHPLFGDINLKYISGVVEYQEELYIILDTDTIFGQEDSGMGMAFSQAAASTLPESPVALEPLAESELSAVEEVTEIDSEVLNYSFVTETLQTFNSFFVSGINEDWIRNRFDKWKQIKGSDSSTMQLSSPADGNEFLTGFASRNTGTFWTEDMAKAVADILPEFRGTSVSAWDIGCGSGFEAYSAAGLLRTKYPEHRIKVWAHDSDLIKVSNAPNMVYRRADLPEWIRDFAEEGSNGWSFASEISDTLTFEYHDVLHENVLPPVNMIIARDLLSYFSDESRAKVLMSFSEKLVPGGILIIGDNEKLASESWSMHEANSVRWYTNIRREMSE